MLLNRLATLCFISIFCFILFAHDVMAGQSVKLRAGDHDNYSRIVFEWDKSPSYSVSKDGDNLSVNFNSGAANVDLSSVNSNNLRNVGSISQDSNQKDSLALTMKIAPDAKFRDFKIGKKIIIDVYDSAKSPNREKQAVNVKPKNLAKETIQHSKNSEKLHTAKNIQNEARQGKQIIVDTIDAEPLKEVGASLGVKTPASDPHVITLTSTKKIGMAVFRRAGYLWIVIDDPSLTVPPQLAGPEKEKFAKFERMDIPGGVAYRMSLPDEFHVYAEGGGLLWRVVISPNERKTKPIQPKSTFDGTSSLAGSSLFWGMALPSKKLQLKDPLIGDMLYIVTVEDASQYAGSARDYVDMQVINSEVGLVLKPWVDDLAVSISPKGVSVTKAGGLSLSGKRDTAPVLLKQKVDEEDSNLNEYGEALPTKEELSRIYNFKSWEMGGPHALEENQRVLMVGMSDKDGYGKVEGLLTLAKLNIANNRGVEALGLLRVAENELSGIEQSPEFISLRGAAGTLAGQYDVAIPNLFDKELQSYGEIAIWKATALAGLEDWKQAYSVMPDNLDLIAEYPRQIRYPIALKLAEASLRSGDIDRAESLLALIDEHDKNITAPVMAAYNYLSAEAARQRGDYDFAMKTWTKLTKSKDDYYRAKSGLSLTRMQLEDKKITPAEAVNRLENLRYAWRGDELETLINYRLGQVYIENKDYLKGLSVLRNAVSLSPDSAISKEVTKYMTDNFRSLFTEGKLDEISTLDAVSIYDEFKELTPAGSEGDVFVQKLAENLVSVDLLGRAGSLLEHQLIHRLTGEDAVRVGLRLAAIRLLDNKPDGALRALDLTNQAIDNMALESNKPYGDERAESQLLRARALSELNRTGEAVEMLDLLAKRRGDDLNIARLKADMAWTAGRWDDAAEAFQTLIVGENISLTRPVTDAQRDLIMNRAIALNLAGNRVALANLRERYGDAMKQTDKARMFELVTRPRQMGLMGSRDSVQSLMSEVDLFGDFLENYRKME